MMRTERTDDAVGDNRQQATRQHADKDKDMVSLRRGHVNAVRLAAALHVIFVLREHFCPRPE